jgi:hypothetical protein
MGTNIENRKVEKIQVTITVDKPDPMPMMLHEQVGSGKSGDKKISVDRNMNGNLLLINIDDNGYVVDVGEIVKGLLAHEEQ